MRNPAPAHFPREQDASNGGTAMPLKGRKSAKRIGKAMKPGEP
jgi:hypothetical protein